MALKRVQSTDREINQLQTNLIDYIQPVINSQIVSGYVIQNVALRTGISNVVPHGLGRPLIGWFIVRQRGPASVYDTQDTNTTPAQNLILITSADVSVNLFVF